jgi:hypothetical protein
MTKEKLLMEKFSISGTMAKLMVKYDCQTPDEYRAIRKQRRKDAPKKEPKVVAKPTPVPQKGKKK